MKKLVTNADLNEQASNDSDPSDFIHHIVVLKKEGHLLFLEGPRICRIWVLDVYSNAFQAIKKAQVFNSNPRSAF